MNNEKAASLSNEEEEEEEEHASFRWYESACNDCEIGVYANLWEALTIYI